MIDNSGSIRDNDPPGGNNWQLILNFVKSIIDELIIAPYATRVAVVDFGEFANSRTVPSLIPSLVILNFIVLFFSYPESTRGTGGGQSADNESLEKRNNSDVNSGVSGVKLTQELTPNYLPVKTSREM